MANRAEASTGSIVASMLAKCAQMYASNHPKIHHQNMVRSACFAFYRPIFPMKGPVRMFAREVSTSKRLSTLRVEAFQGGPKVAASADVLYLYPVFSTPGRAPKSTNITSLTWDFLESPPSPYQRRSYQLGGRSCHRLIRSTWTSWPGTKTRVGLAINPHSIQMASVGPALMCRIIFPFLALSQSDTSSSGSRQDGTVHQKGRQTALQDGLPT